MNTTIIDSNALSLAQAIVNWQLIESTRIDGEVSAALFVHVVDIWWQKPHTVNRRLCGAVAVNLEGETETKPVSLVSSPGVSLDSIKYRRLLSKTSQSSVLEILKQGSNGSELFAEFYPVVPQSEGQPIDGETALHPLLPYRISVSLEDKPIEVKLHVADGSTRDSSHSVKWLKNSLFPKLVQWLKSVDDKSTIRQTLRLVDLEAYNRRYQEMKAKYGKRLCETWPEKTDPKKFVYEDIAIATYLLVLWAKERCDKSLLKHQTFVDIGCGNGLLVYLLNSEGHDGYGMDLRKRKIWDRYDRPISLKEEEFVPNDQHLFPEIDWLIGNHSDELTPWLSVIAAKSSTTCQYFVIPCCAFDFHGKFQRRGAGGDSLFRCYLNYVKNVGEVCGFRPEEDTLKIPSTKRICFVGFRNTCVNDSAVIVNKISDMIQANAEKYSPHGPNSKRIASSTDDGETFLKVTKCDPDQNSHASSGWTNSFTAREKVEAVRNCTKIPRCILDEIVSKIAGALLASENIVTVEQEHDVSSRVLLWNIGGELALADCIKLLTAGEIVCLKNQFGGLQTLIRNHKNVFDESRGTVRLRKWFEKDNLKKFPNKAKRNCWFYLNHPQGCPYTADQCSYVHPALSSFAD